MQTKLFRPTVSDLQLLSLALADAGFKSNYASSDIAGMRTGNAELTQLASVRKVVPGVAVESFSLHGVPCERLLAPRTEGGAGMGAIVYLHGGGFVRGSLELGRANASAIAHAAGLPVIAVGYRQAPEHPYPAAIEDVATAFLALAECGHDPSSSVVIGESSGGTLAICLLAWLRDHGRALPRGVAAISPMADLSFRGASWLYNAGRDVADLETAQRMTSLYLGGAHAAHPWASPAEGGFEDRVPMLVVAGTRETMLSDAEFVARKASQAGAPVDVCIFEDMPHGFTRFDVPIASQALSHTALWCANIVR